MQILVNEDDLATRKMLRFVLEQQAGHSVTEAESSEAALRLLADQAFEMLITDLVLPGLDGYELVNRVRRYSPIPILVAGSGERYLLRVVAQHADWWLSYGDRPQVLERQLRVLVAHCRDVGRDPASIRRATPLTVYLDRDRAAARRWAGAALDAPQPPFAGDPAALRDRLAELAALGFDLVQLRFAGLFGTRDIQLFADEVLPAHRARLVAGRDALAGAVGEHLPDWDFRVPDGGLALWCELPAPLGTALTEEAARRGVVVAPGPVFAVEGGLDRFVRIPWTADPDQLVEATRRLAAAWEVVAADGGPRPGRPSRVLVA